MLACSLVAWMPMALQATEKVAASQAAVEARVVTPLMEFIMKKYAKKSAKRGQQPKQGPTKVVTALGCTQAKHHSL